MVEGLNFRDGHAIRVIFHFRDLLFCCFVEPSLEVWIVGIERNAEEQSVGPPPRFLLCRSNSDLHQTTVRPDSPTGMPSAS